MHEPVPTDMAACTEPDFRDCQIQSRTTIVRGSPIGV